MSLPSRRIQAMPNFSRMALRSSRFQSGVPSGLMVSNVSSKSAPHTSITCGVEGGGRERRQPGVLKRKRYNPWRQRTRTRPGPVCTGPSPKRIGKLARSSAMRCSDFAVGVQLGERRAMSQNRKNKCGCTYSDCRHSHESGMIQSESSSARPTLKRRKKSRKKKISNPTPRSASHVDAVHHRHQ